MAVHSAQLAAEAARGTTPAVVYTVPTGKRTIVKCIVVVNSAAATNRTVFQFAHAGTTYAYYLAYPTASNAVGDCVIALPWIVLNAGDTIKVNCSTGTVAYVISGSELTL